MTRIDRYLLILRHIIDHPLEIPPRITYVGDPEVIHNRVSFHNHAKR